MFPTTLQATAAVLLLLLPGALAVWGFERHAGTWGIRLPDRLFRLIGVSVAVHAVAAPLTYLVWRRYLESGGWETGAQLPWGLWIALLLYVTLPAAVGSVAGRASRAESPWIRLLTGPARAPRAWDAFFFGRAGGWIRLKLKSGSWIGGAFAQGSYAAVYPEPSDIYLTWTAEVDPSSGAFAFDEHERVVLRDSGVLIRWEEVEYLEFIDG
ncbi:MAG: DUF6338 family protein [Gaiellaceae bacterium]